jgi:putative hydrolase of the HAD superfamily
MIETIPRFGRNAARWFAQDRFGLARLVGLLNCHAQTRQRSPPILPPESRDLLNKPIFRFVAPVGGDDVSAILARFRHVETWVFDLDNTLYPPDSALWPMIDERITLFLMQMFGLDGLSARALQRFYYGRYGTTLRGLIDEYSVKPEEFLAFVHEIDRSSLAPNPPLAAEIASLPGRKLILTNGSRDHALRTAAQLGLGALFEDAFDIVAANMIPKPAAEAYDAFFKKYGVDPRRAAMFEDIARNLAVPHQRGMTTILVQPRLDQKDHREAGDRFAEDSPIIDFATSDLVGFLQAVNIQLKLASPAAE